LGLTFESLGAGVALLDVVEVVTVGPGAFRAGCVGSTCASSRAHVPRLTDLSFVVGHACLVAVVLGRAQEQSRFSTDASQRGVLSSGRRHRSRGSFGAVVTGRARQAFAEIFLTSSVCTKCSHWARILAGAGTSGTEVAFRASSTLVNCHGGALVTSFAFNATSDALREGEFVVTACRACNDLGSRRAIAASWTWAQLEVLSSWHAIEASGAVSASLSF